MVTTTQKLLKPLSQVQDFISRLRISWQDLHKFHPCEFILDSSWIHRGFIVVSSWFHPSEHDHHRHPQLVRSRSGVANLDLNTSSLRA